MVWLVSLKGQIMRYTNTSKSKENGIVYTPTAMAEYLAHEMITYDPPRDNCVITVLDPAVGGGELLIALFKALSASSNSKIMAVGYETDSAICKKTQQKLEKQFPNISISIKNEDFLKAVKEKTKGKYDYIIANPPYIRTQIMGSNRAQEISSDFGLTGRIDIYYAFIVCAGQVLKETGIAGFITSNKFLTIKSGSSVRNYILDNYCVHRITDFGDTKLFPASVLPCITVFSKGKTADPNSVHFTSVYHTDENGEKNDRINDIFDPIYKSGCYVMPDGRTLRYQQGTLQSVQKDALWNIQLDNTKKWLERVERNTWQYFSALGKVRVGIKTTADNVFIGDDWSGEKANIELLRPLITHRNAGQIIQNNSAQWQVLYTHTTVNGEKTAYDIEEYPNAKKYLEHFYEQLSGRKYIADAKRNWYEIWVPQNPDAWRHRKIVFRDISEQPQFWLDTSGAIVNGDCYWIEIKDDVMDDVVYLTLAIANSRFIEKYYDVKFNTKLYSGKRRFMAQYVEHFPIPLYSTELAQEAICTVKKIIAENNQQAVLSYKNELDDIVDRLFI